MAARPSFLGPKYGSAFEDPSVVAVYHTRPPYPEELFALLTELLGSAPEAVLDLGCGTGIIARRLAGVAQRVDALDASAAMISEAKRLPNGEHPALRWMLGRAEEAPLQPPYAMVTAAASLHWMEWSIVLPRLHDALTPGGRLVIIVDNNRPPPWQAELIPILQRYSTNQEYQSGFDLVNALQERGLFQVEERRLLGPVPFRQSIDAYVESFHGRSGFARGRMDPVAATEFDEAVRSLVQRHGETTVELQIVADVAWGRPSRA